MDLLHETQTLYVKRRLDGNYGLFTNVIRDNSEIIINIEDGDKQNKRDLRTIETDNGHFFHCLGGFTNHSCQPTTRVDKENGTLYAIKKLSPHSEITFNYLESEKKISKSFQCNCGNKDCKGFISKLEKL